MRAEEVRIRRDELTARLRAIEDAIEQVRDGIGGEAGGTDRIVSSELDNLQDQRENLLKEIAAVELPDAPRD